jgi:hypothetical protein
MGIDKKLDEAYPSVIINRARYEYGRDPELGGFLVENAFCAKDQWYFEQEDDLRAFLINLPFSADRGLRVRLHPDWADVTDEQRDVYLKQDDLLSRAWAEEKTRNGQAQCFNVDFYGRRGPHVAQRVAAAGRSPDDAHWVVGEWRGPQAPACYEDVWFRNGVALPMGYARTHEPGARPLFVMAEIVDVVDGRTASAVVVAATEDRKYLDDRGGKLERGATPVLSPEAEWDLTLEHRAAQSKGSELGQADRLLENITRHIKRGGHSR